MSAIVMQFDHSLALPFFGIGMKTDLQSCGHSDDTTLMAESEEELKSLFMKVKEKKVKIWLKTQHSNS